MGLTMQATTELKTAEGKSPRLIAAFQAHITTDKARDELQQTDLNKIKLTEAFKKAMRQIVLKAETTTSTARDAELDAKAATTFGSPDQFSENSKAKIDNEEIPKGISGDENNPKTLGTINDIAQLYRIFFHYKDANTKVLEIKITELKKKINKGASKTPEQICNDIGDENERKCNTTKECIFNKTGEKNRNCTLSEEERKEAAKEQANQETGGKDGKPEEKSAKHGTDKNACDKDSNCKCGNNA
ncbi:Trypanosome variant surface glycoprotein (A-type) [Trypanosoma brucei equiperdum]|uniref:Trypanosome variant surface glycoprotein (A-type) n=1 Tax=Trypanosoma brucei equiperdum TaxID=630700 RepID=A0A3L6LCI3_9TRYP|nr:Trypanosome variant surface glycoprotein (A-type) [Trypanosoma brucei equiperdum]